MIIMHMNYLIEVQFMHVSLLFVLSSFLVQTHSRASMFFLHCLFVWQETHSIESNEMNWNEMNSGAWLSICRLDISMAFLLLLIHRYIEYDFMWSRSLVHPRARGFYNMCASPVIFDRLCDNLICREPLFDQFISKWTSNRVNWMWLAVWHFIQSLRFALAPFLSPCTFCF